MKEERKIEDYLNKLVLDNIYNFRVHSLNDGVDNIINKLKNLDILTNSEKRNSIIAETKKIINYHLLNTENIKQRHEGVNIEDFNKNMDEKFAIFDLRMEFKDLNISFPEESLGQKELIELLRKNIEKIKAVNEFAEQSYGVLTATKLQLLSNNNQETMNNYKERLAIVFNIFENKELICPFKIGKRITKDIAKFNNTEFNDELYRDITIHLLKLDLKSKNLNEDAANLLFNLSMNDYSLNIIKFRNEINKDSLIISPVDMTTNWDFIALKIENNIEKYTSYLLNSYSDGSKEQIYSEIFKQLNKKELLDIKEKVDLDIYPETHKDLITRLIDSNLVKFKDNTNTNFFHLKK